MSMSTQKAINYVEKDKKDYSERKQQVDCLIEISEEALEKITEVISSELEKLNELKN